MFYVFDEQEIFVEFVADLSTHGRNFFAVRARVEERELTPATVQFHGYQPFRH